MGLSALDWAIRANQIDLRPGEAVLSSTQRKPAVGKEGAENVQRKIDERPSETFPNRFFFV